MDRPYDLLSDGKQHPVTARDDDEFLNGLLSVCGRTTYLGEWWDFGVATGAGKVRLFRRREDACYGIETPYLNPLEFGSFESQTRRWVLQWLEVGRRNPLIRRAFDPLFGIQSFRECQTDDELLDRLAYPAWPNGQAFHIGNLCFINQIHKGNLWLAVKETTPIESIPFAFIVYDSGRDAARVLIDDLRAATIEQCRRLEHRARR